MQCKCATEEEARTMAKSMSGSGKQSVFIAIVESQERTCPEHGIDPYPGKRDFCCPKVEHGRVFYVEDDEAHGMLRIWEREVAF